MKADGNKFKFELRCVEQPIAPDIFHIYPSTDECWINEMYTCKITSMISN